MKKKNKIFGAVSAGALLSFLLWTALLCFADVQPIGPLGSSVGLAALNGFVHERIGVNMTLYTVTDWLGLLPLSAMLFFASIGLYQWITRKSILRVDFSLLCLGGFYLLVMAAYLFFEVVPLNYRPVLIDGVLEASYPSSTTLLVLTVMPTAAIQSVSRLKNAALRHTAVLLIGLFTVAMVVGRLFSGVHWATDIIGGIFISAALVFAYLAVTDGRR